MTIVATVYGRSAFPKVRCGNGPARPTADESGLQQRDESHPLGDMVQPYAREDQEFLILCSRLQNAVAYPLPNYRGVRPVCIVHTYIWDILPMGTAFVTREGISSLSTSILDLPNVYCVVEKMIRRSNPTPSHISFIWLPLRGATLDSSSDQAGIPRSKGRYVRGQLCRRNCPPTCSRLRLVTHTPRLASR